MTLMLLILPRPGSALIQRNRRAYLGAVAWLADDRERSPQRLHALAHADETKAAAGPGGAQLAMTIDANRQPQRGTVVAREIDDRLRGSGVARDVGQALAHESIDGNVDAVAEFFQVSGEIQLEVDPGIARGPQCDGFPERVFESQQIEFGGAQALHDRVHAIVDAARDVLDAVRGGTDVGHAVAGAL